MAVSEKDMTIVDVYRSEEDVQRFANIFSGALGAGLGAMSDDDCPYCHGKGIAYFSPKDNYNYLWGFIDTKGSLVR